MNVIHFRKNVILQNTASACVILLLTTHAAELSFVGRWHGDVGMVVTVKAHPQAEGCLQDNEFATIVDFNTISSCDRWGHRCPIHLNIGERLLIIMDCKEENTVHLDLLRCHERIKELFQRTNLDFASFLEDNRDSIHIDHHGLHVGNLLVASSVFVLGVHGEVW